ncbi:MAG: serine hydrolase domain-containing protein [Bacteroidota bacterium]
MKQIALLSIILLFTNSFLLGQKGGSEITNLLQKEMTENNIPGLQVAVIQNNELVFSEALGLANVQFGIKAEKNTIFSINSISKIFAATAAMQLVEEGKLNIAHPISNYLEGLPATWQKVTITQLLSHTSGLPDIEGTSSGDLVGGKGMETAWVEVQKMPLQFEAGEQFSYNATNYLLLEKVIEQLSGLNYETLVKQKQFDVANMEMTFYGDNSFEVVPNRSPTYSFYVFDKEVDDYVLKEELMEVTEEFPIKADAGAFTTAEEAAKWIIALQSGKLLSQKSIDTMWKPVPLNNGEFDGFGGLLNAYAFGWPVIKREEHPGVSAFGGGRASLSIYPEENLAIVLFTNLSGLPTFEIVEKISKFYLD